MTENIGAICSPLQHANQLLRDKEWEKSLNAYYALWNNSPHLQRLIAWNMAYLIQKAPKDILGKKILTAAMELLRSSDLVPKEPTGADAAPGIMQQSRSRCHLTEFSAEPLRTPSQPVQLVDLDSKIEALNRVNTQEGAATENMTQPERTSSILASCRTAKLHTQQHMTGTFSRNALYEAFVLAKSSGFEKAISYAEEHLPADLRYTSNILQANAALMDNNHVEWLRCLNSYLSYFGVTPVRIRPGPHLLARLTTDPLPLVHQGPLITVIMPVWNGQDTVEYAARSILAQTWRPLDLIIVDDASTDGTWSVLLRLAAHDSRVRILRNRVNVGPYVSKNIALMKAVGEFVTGHDADDWAHPQRLERQIADLLKDKQRIRASVGHMLRMTSEGSFDFVSKINDFTFDGVSRKALISCIFRRDDLREKLGYWDSVRFAADSEMMARASSVLGEAFRVSRQIGMLCLDHEGGLTNDPVHGIRTANGGLSESRKSYRTEWRKWHREFLPEKAYLHFPQEERRYSAEKQMIVPYAKQIANLDESYKCK